MHTMKLEIQYLSGDTEVRPLDPEQSISIGRAGSCEVQVDEEGVAPLHCRLSWNGSAWQLKAANLDGVEVNGQLVRETDLVGDDVIRVGSIDIRFVAESSASDSGDSSEGFIPLATSADDISLKPLDAGEAPAGYVGAGAVDEEEEGEEIRLPAEVRRERAAAESPSRPKSKSSGKRRRRESGSAEASEPSEHPINQIFDDDDDFGDDTGGLDDSDDEEEAVVPMPGGKVLSRSRSEEEEELSSEPSGAGAQADPGPGLAERLKPVARRPGDQETLKSPVVLFLGGFAVFLLLASTTFYFMFSRNTVEGLFELAEAEVEEGSYKQAIAHLEEFLELYPNNDEFSPRATFLVNQSRVESKLGGAKQWAEALAAVDRYRKECQDYEDYEPERKLYLFNTVVSIAIGCATEAGESLSDTAKGRELIELSEEAGRKLSLYKTDEALFDTNQVRMGKARTIATAELLRQEALDAGLARIATSLEAKKPIEVLIERRNLLIRYSEFKNEAKLKSRLQDALALEKTRIVSDTTVRSAKPTAVQSTSVASLSLTLNTRVRTDEKSEGRTVFVIGRDCFYGIDTVTGHPTWRRIVGLDLPFSPMPVATAEPGLLLVDTNRHELVLLSQKDGTVLGRLPLVAGQRVVGPPLVVGLQAYVVSESNGRGHLSKISLEDLNQSAQLSFSQPITAPPVLFSGGKQLVVAGHREVIYTIDMGGFSCEAVSYLGHPAGSIESPMLSMGALVLLPQNGDAAASGEAGASKAEVVEGGASSADGDQLVVVENDRLKSCLLRIVRLAENGSQLAVVAEAEERVSGHVRDRAILRGRDLFVPISGERLVAFSVSDDPTAKAALTKVGSHQVQTPHAGAIHLSVGPGGWLWMASSKLQRFQRTSEGIKVDANRIADGLSSQPLQSIGNQLFVGRRLTHSASVVFTRVDRDAKPRMTTHWRTVVGCGLLECQQMSNGLLLCLTETGGLFHVRDKELDTAGFKFNIEGELRLPVGLATPLSSARLGDGRVVVWCGLPAARMWILNTVGTIEQEIDLQKEALEAAPVLTEGGIVAPLPGRLKLLARSSGQGPAREFPAPVSDGKKRAWKKTVAVDSKHLLVLDDGGDLVRLQYRTAPAPHLYPIATLRLAAPLDRDPLLHQGKVILATSDRKLQVLGAADLQVAATTDLPGPPTAGPWGVENRVVVETGQKQLVCLDLADKLKVLWTIDTGGHSVAGSPLIVDGRMLLALDNGRVMVVDPADGTIGRSVELGQPVALGPRGFGKKILVTSIDGTLYRVESLLAQDTSGGSGGE
jgi:pSer/pThr/pTyr-binding forkhead associated (FHA) protein/TolA-binding protein